MKDYLRNQVPQGEKVISFVYREEEQPVPTGWTDPIELLGDLSQLILNESDLLQLRAILMDELITEGPESIWRGRAFRKNVMYSFHTIV
ncbi:MAG: hypothetical protein R3Y11_10145 [Pseudomonadota bacterium]